MQIFYRVSLTWSDFNKRWYSVTRRLVGNLARPSTFWTSSRGRKHFNWPTSVWAKLWTIWKLWESLSATRAARIHDASIICTAVWQRWQLVNKFYQCKPYMQCRETFFYKLKKNYKECSLLQQRPIHLDQGRQIRLRTQALLPFVRKHGRPLRLPMLVHKMHQNSSCVTLMHIKCLIQVYWCILLELKLVRFPLCKLCRSQFSAGSGVWRTRD